MTYSLGAFVGIFYEAIILIILSFLLIQIYRTYLVSRLKLTLDLSLAFIFVNMAVFFSWIAKFYLWRLGGEFSDEAINGEFLLMLIYKFKLSLVCVVVSNIFFSRFFKTMYSEDGTRPPIEIKMVIRKIIEISLIIGLMIPTYITRDHDVAEIMDAITFFIAVIDSIYFLPAFYKGYKYSKNNLFGKKYFNIGMMALFMFGIYPMFFIERMSITLGILGPFGELGFTVFYFAAWICVIIVEMFSYYGYIRK